MRVVEKYTQASLNELQRKGYHVLFVQINNRRGFLVGNSVQIAQIKGRYVIVEVEETHKNSIMKQAMSMQMGKPIGATRKEMCRYYAHILKMPNAGRFPVWEIV